MPGFDAACGCSLGACGLVVAGAVVDDPLSVSLAGFLLVWGSLRALFYAVNQGAAGLLR